MLWLSESYKEGSRSLLLCKGFDFFFCKYFTDPFYFYDYGYSSSLLVLQGLVPDLADLGNLTEVHSSFVAGKTISPVSTCTGCPFLIEPFLVVLDPGMIIYPFISSSSTIYEFLTR